MRTLLLLVVLGAAPLHVRAATPIAVPVGGRVYVLPDADVANGATPVAAVLAGHGRFAPFDRGALGGAKNDIWLRFYVSAPSKDHRVLIRLSNIDAAEFYAPTAGKTFTREITGANVPHARWSIPYNMPTFTLDPNVTAGRPFYIHVQFHADERLQIVLDSEARYFIDSIGRRLLHGLFLGVLLALAAFNLYAFFLLRERWALLYAIYLVVLGINELVATGIGGQYLWPNMGGDARFAISFCHLLAFAAFLVFARSFLQSRQMLPRLDAAAVSLFAGQVILALVAFLAPNETTFMLPVLIFQSAAMMLWAWIGILRWSRGFAPARFFVIAFPPSFIGIITNLAYNAYRPAGDWFWASNGVELGAIAQCIIISCSVLDRITTLEAERRDAERALALEEKRNQELSQIALTDPLTGIANRLAYYDALRAEIEEANEFGRCAGVLFIDLDGFKRINDRYGHLVGDELLRIVAKRLAATVRAGDLAARIGGDEFAVLVRGVIEIEELAHARYRVRTAFDVPVSVGDLELTVRASVGVGSYPLNGATPDELINAADRSMYGEKQMHLAQAIQTTGP